MVPAYPINSRERTAWIVAHRGERNVLDARRPRAFFVEDEATAEGEVVSVATIFLTNRECPWRCLMCDLWRHTLLDSVPPGAVPAQIEYALNRLPPARVIKLYNSGSFFDPRAIPPEDHDEIVANVASFDRVIVECHPAFVSDNVRRFRARLPGTLEVAMGLETVHPDILPKLNKQMTLRQFARVAAFLRASEIALRAFVLVQPPFLDEQDAIPWAVRSLQFAFDCGATAATLIPTRGGNGALEALALRGEFSPPKLATLEGALSEGMALRKGRVFADLWDLERFSSCRFCFEPRAARLRHMNLRQTVISPVDCLHCGAV